MRSETQREREMERATIRGCFLREEGREGLCLDGFFGCCWLRSYARRCQLNMKGFHKYPWIFVKLPTVPFLCGLSVLWQRCLFGLLTLFYYYFFPGFVDFANSLRYLAATGFGSTRNFIFFLSLLFFLCILSFPFMYLVFTTQLDS